MTDYRTIYTCHAELYHRLIKREDFRQALPDAIGRICPAGGRRVAEIGAGTGRLTKTLAMSARSVRAFDEAPTMLAVAARELRECAVTNCALAAAENSALPLADSAVDIVAAGWSIGHTPGWYPEDWRGRIEKVLAEMHRVAAPGGDLLIIETLGTNSTTPVPPPHLEDYYAMLHESGFALHSIRTDYRFDTMEEAEELLRFFFGDELAEAVLAKGDRIVPECTGIWLKRVEP